VADAEELAAIAHRAADDLNALAGDITKAIDALPLGADQALRELMYQHARRAKAISAALRVEAADPDSRMVGLLLAVGKALAAMVMAALLAFSGAAGNDAWQAVHHRADGIAGPSVESYEDMGPVERREALGAYIRELRTARGASMRTLAKALEKAPSTIRRWEMGEGAPGPEDISLLGHAFELSNADMDKLRRLYVG
jgi:hypothetical protein